MTAIVPLCVCWSDIGSWAPFHQRVQQDDSGNACSGDVMTEGAGDCYFTANHKLLIAICVRGLVVET